ncbi:MAG: hypothetical protein WC674_01210, partial [Candidatus Krumholzibacteriia bacterium]
MNRIQALSFLVLLAAVPAIAEEQGTAHRSAPVGSAGGIMNPDLSVVVNSMVFFTDDTRETERNKLFIKETEIAFQSYLYPGIRGDFIVAMHPEGTEWHVHPEEAVVSFLDLPFGLQAQAGRRLIPFGRLNAVHPHHWMFATTPLPLTTIFGEHAWFDDGVNLDWLLPNPWGVYCKLAAGVWSGETVAGHAGEETESEETHHEHASIAWQGTVYSARANLDFPVDQMSNIGAGYSAAWDDGSRTVLHGCDLTLTYRRPLSYHRLRWASELFLADTKDSGSPFGFYSLLAFTPDKYWEIGARYDRSELFAAHEKEHEEDPVVNDDE